MGESPNSSKDKHIMKARAMKQRTRPASDVKEHWRDIVADAKANGEVFVTHYNRPEVVVVSLDRYSKLKAEALANDPLATLRAEFDRELAYLREPEAQGELRGLFAATPDELAHAANAASRRKS
jgi:PHD/YefM family antitoxin component YafN of YafNO toxin-antitoxin module